MEDAQRMQKELLAREYGSNILKIVQFIKQNPDKGKRTEQTKLLLRLIERLNPSVKYAENSDDVLLGHIYIMADCALDVDIEFTIPDVNLSRPEKVPYPSIKPKNRHYGRNVEILCEHLSKLENKESKEEAALSLGKLLKTLYVNYNHDSVGDDLIAKDIVRLTNGNLKINQELVMETEDNGKNSLFYSHRKKGALPSNNQPAPKQNFRNGKRNQNKGKKKQRTDN